MKKILNLFLICSLVGVASSCGTDDFDYSFGRPKKGTLNFRVPGDIAYTLETSLDKYTQRVYVEVNTSLSTTIPLHFKHDPTLVDTYNTAHPGKNFLKLALAEAFPVETKNFNAGVKECPVDVSIDLSTMPLDTPYLVPIVITNPTELEGSKWNGALVTYIEVIKRQPKLHFHMFPIATTSPDAGTVMGQKAATYYIDAAPAYGTVAARPAYGNLKAPFEGNVSILSAFETTTALDYTLKYTPDSVSLYNGIHGTSFGEVPGLVRVTSGVEGTLPAKTTRFDHVFSFDATDMVRNETYLVPFTIDFDATKLGTAIWEGPKTVYMVCSVDDIPVPVVDVYGNHSKIVSAYLGNRSGKPSGTVVDYGYLSTRTGSNAETTWPKEIAKSQFRYYADGSGYPCLFNIIDLYAAGWLDEPHQYKIEINTWMELILRNSTNAGSGNWAKKNNSYYDVASKTLFFNFEANESYFYNQTSATAHAEPGPAIFSLTHID